MLRYYKTVMNLYTQLTLTDIILLVALIVAAAVVMLKLV